MTMSEENKETKEEIEKQIKLDGDYQILNNAYKHALSICSPNQHQYWINKLTIAIAEFLLKDYQIDKDQEKDE